MAKSDWLGGFAVVNAQLVACNATPSVETTLTVRTVTCVLAGRRSVGEKVMFRPSPERAEDPPTAVPATSNSKAEPALALADSDRAGLTSRATFVASGAGDYAVTVSAAAGAAPDEAKTTSTK